MVRITNNEIIDRYLEIYIYSKQSSNMRKSSLNYFFEKVYFGFDGHIFDITKSNLIDYFDYLNKLNTISLTTKKNKWQILRGFLQFCSEYYDNFQIIIPKYSIKWQSTHKKAESNKDIVMTMEEVTNILNYFKVNHFTYYLFFRILAETGMRKGGLINFNIDKNTEKKLRNRTIFTKEKTGMKEYYISKDLSEFLLIYLKERKLEKVKTIAFFLSQNKKRFSRRTFNLRLKNILDKLNLDKNITCHTFRKTLNTLRYEMGCPDGDLEFLLGHAISLNRDKYVKLTHEQKLELYDKWYPYSTISI